MSDASDRPRRRRQAQPAPPPQGSAIKGIILVVVAVLVGLLLLRDDGASTAQVAVGAGDDPTEPSDGTTTSSSSTTAAPRPPAEVKVLVANGSGVDRAAGALTEDLRAQGYVTANPDNSERVTATVIHYTDGYQAEAEKLAGEIGAPTSAVSMIPTPAPVTDLQLSNLLVILGPDLATSG